MIDLIPITYEGEVSPFISLAFQASHDDPLTTDLIVKLPEIGSDAPASHALMAGLALLALERQGMVAKAIETMFPNGQPTVSELLTMAALLMRSDPSSAIN